MWALIGELGPSRPPRFSGPCRSWRLCQSEALLDIRHVRSPAALSTQFSIPILPPPSCARLSCLRSRRALLPLLDSLLKGPLAHRKIRRS
jgi:hypothetical protein